MRDGPFELRAGREGDDHRVRVTVAHPLYHELLSVMSCARFAADEALTHSYGVDRHPASIHRLDDD